MRRIAKAVVVAAAMMAAGGVAVAADVAEHALVIQGNRFTPDEIRVKAGAPFVLVVTNKDKAAEELESKPLRLEKVIPGGKTVRVRMPALKAGTYDFVGEYHESTAKGRFVAE